MMQYPVFRNRADAGRQLAQRLGDLAVVPGATHLFEEPGALEDVSRLAANCFDDHLVREPSAIAAG